MRKILFCVLIYWLSLIIGLAAEPLVLEFSHKDGLISNTIDAIEQDSDGYLYFATNRGLSIFDGTSFERFNAENTPGFSNTLTALACIDSMHILIGSMDQGLFILNKKSGDISPIRFNNIVLSNIRSVHITQNGELWIVTPEEGLFYLKNVLSLIIDEKEEPALTKVIAPFSPVYALESDHHQIYVASHNNIIHTISGDENNFYIEKIRLPEEVLQTHSLSLVQDRELWVGTEQGIYILKKINNDEYGFHKKINLPDGIVRSMKKINQWLYIVVEGNGIFRINIMTHSLEFCDYIKTRNPISAFVGIDSSLWVGSWNDGLYCLRSQDNTFNRIPYERDNKKKNIVWNFSPSEHKGAYIMTNGMGICYYDSQEASMKTISDFYPNVYCVRKKKNSSCFYVGTWGNGLKIFDSQRKAYLSTSLFDQINGCRVFCMDSITPRHLLIGTYPAGPFMLDVDTDELIKLNLPDSLNELNIRRFFPANSPDTYWMATFNKGLFQFKLTKEGTIDNLRQIASNNNVIRIENIIPDGEKIWLCLTDGLAFIEESELSELLVKRITEIGNVHVKSIWPAGRDRYWLATLSGLMFYDRRQQSVRNFFPNEPFYSVGPTKDSVCLMVGSSDDLLFLDPERLLEKSSEIRPVIRSIHIDGQSSKRDTAVYTSLQYSPNYIDTLYLPARINTVGFSLSALNNELSSGLIYYYKIDGVDTKWNRTEGKEVTLVYGGIPAGTYTFRIRMNAVDNMRHEKKIILVKTDYWWNAGWFRIVSGILIVCLFALLLLPFIRYRFHLKMMLLKQAQEEELYQQRIRFFTNMSHDLKTPLTLLLTPLQDMLENPLMPPVFKNRLSVMNLNGEQLLKRINRILNYKSSLVQEDSLDCKNYPVNQLLFNIVFPFKEYAERRGIHFEFEETEHLSQTLIYTDYSKIESILENLISNAIKYTLEGGKVLVTCREKDQMLQIRISDTGIGIPLSQQQHIYDRFFRIKDDDRGTGIGLFVVKQYVGLLGGEIHMHSKEETGTCFEVSLPISGSTHETSINAHLQESENKADSGSECQTLLIVDDNKEIRDYLEEIFHKSYRVIQGCNGDQAIELARREIPDLIITDLMMPGSDGTEVCRTLKTDIRTSHIPIVILTAKSARETKVECWTSGVDLIEEKPFNRRLFYVKVENILKNRQYIKYKYLLQSHSASCTAENLKEENLDEKFIRQLNEAIEESGNTPDLSIETLANKLSLKHDQLYRKLKALTGMSVNQYIRTYRLNQAAALLKSRKFMVTEVLYRVGFNNPSYFTKCFKKEFGVSPSEYLMKMDQEEDFPKECH